MVISFLKGRVLISLPITWKKKRNHYVAIVHFKVIPLL